MLAMMAFMTALLRIFVAIGIALVIIGGAVSGWFLDALPLQSAGIDPARVGAPSLGLRATGAVFGLVGGLVLATVTFGVLALLLDIRDRLVSIDRALSVERKGRGEDKDGAKTLNYER
jgi:hypothetical protein